MEFLYSVVNVAYTVYENLCFPERDIYHVYFNSLLCCA